MSPNLDNLCESGLKLTSFYAQPISGPARTSFLTGCYPLRVAEVDNVKRLHPMVHSKEVLIPEILKTEGYISACIGKWDINGHQHRFVKDEIYPTEMGFDYWYGLPSSNDGGVVCVYRNRENLGKDVALDSLTQRYTQEALEFIDGNSSTPFFLYLAHSMPHTRLGVSDEFKGRSRGGVYGDVVQELDWSVGKIVERVKELGLDRDTYIIFTSDNGPWTARELHAGSAYPLRGEKCTTWEGGVRVPCIVWGCGIEQREYDGVTSLMDLLPTFASLGGAAVPDSIKIDGRDISPLFLDGDTPKDESAYYLYYLESHLQAVRKGDWKLVIPRPHAPEWLFLSNRSMWVRDAVDAVRDYELYNLALDPSERRDVIAQWPEKKEELLKLVEDARRDIGDFDTIGEGARFYDDQPKRPDAESWRQKIESGWNQSIEVHKFYDDGARYNLDK